MPPYSDLQPRVKLPLPLPWPMNSTQKLSVPIPVRYIEEWISVQEKIWPTIP